MIDPKLPLGFTPEQFRRLQEMAGQAQVVIDRHKAMIAQFQPVLEKVHADLERFRGQTQQAVNLLLPRFEVFSQNMQRALEVLRPTLEAIGKQQKKAALVEGSGWLPHYTTPFSEILETETPEQVHERLSAFYRDRWDEVRPALTEAMEKIDVDAEAKATFAEALRAHERGDFRCAPRLLFPEIERVGREKLKLKQEFSGKVHLVEPAEGLPIGIVLRELGGGVKLLEKLIDQVYLKVRGNPNSAEILADTVPNRHAAIHGLAVYNTQQTSLNAIIIAEFTFLFIEVLQRYSEETPE